jgi:hypothetical protein
VHEFGEISVLAERDGPILGDLLGFVSPYATGVINELLQRDESVSGSFPRRCRVVHRRGEW